MKYLRSLFSYKNVLLNYSRTCCKSNPVIYSLNVPDEFGCRFSSNASLINDNAEIKQLLDEFSEPKKILWRIINETHVREGIPNVKPEITTDQIKNSVTAQSMWRVTIDMSWPQKFKAVGVSSKKSEAETLSYLNACMKMKSFGVLDKDNKPAVSRKQSLLSEELLKISKSTLCNLYQRIWTKYGKKEYIPKFHNSNQEGIFGKDSLWKSQLTLSYPETQVFEGFSSRLRSAESLASAKALLWLRERGVIDSKGRLLQYSNEEELKFLKHQQEPYSIFIPEDIQDKMSTVLLALEEENKHSSDNPSIPNEVNNKLKDSMYDVITENIYHEPLQEDIDKRSKKMYHRLVSFLESNDSSIQEIRKAKMNLPIHDKRLDILKLVNENQVLVLSGETGCGKTTQVPQYILNSFVEKFEGAKCNIVVTQPRRISAISIADRVAQERGEKVGDTVGHHVRLNKKLPKQKGAILYCSTGMLLRKLCSNPNLEGISHVIVDEVHERNMQIDFLLILLKRLLESNKDIKLLLMSASFNTNIFSQYFNNCPVIHIPGTIYPVKEYFLEDLQTSLPYIRHPTGPALDVDLAASVINHIHRTQKPGAILCFLPGWHDILNVKNRLLEISEGMSEELKIYCAHSRLPHEEQKMIFSRPGSGVRKIVLATNIAETSITIDDVVYVVNSGLHKGTSFDGERGVASLGTRWITKANVRQRRGRAGRVQPGVCYNLFSRKVLMGMEDYPVPELLRMPLENVILDCKLYCPESKAEDFLSMAIQPPSRAALQAGVSELQICGVLDENENLTDLGKIVVNFATHPRLSVALVYASFLGCLDPVLTICAILTAGKEPFINTLEEKSIIKKIKQEYDNYLCSDHLALHRLFDTWTKLRGKSDLKEFIEQNLLDEQNLNFIKELKSLFAADLHNYSLIDDQKAFLDPENKCNVNSNHMPSIFAALTAAFYPNVIKLVQGEITHGKINKDALIYSLLKGQRGYIQKESVVSNEQELPSPWLIYFNALQSEARRLMMTSSVSSIPGVCLLLFAGNNVTVQNSEAGDSTLLILDDHKKMTFSCSRREAYILMLYRSYLQKSFTTYIRTLEKEEENVCKTSVLPVLREILSTPQVPFTKGQTYRFVNSTLVSEDL